jgi:hypothetical protein
MGRRRDRRSAALRGLTANDRAAVDDCADYLLSNAPYLRYDRTSPTAFRSQPA